jgi:hypothetical protein
MVRVIKSRSKIWAGHVARIGEMRNAFNIPDGKPEGKRPLCIHRYRWYDNIKSKKVKLPCA